MDPEGFEPCEAPCKGLTFSMCFKNKKMDPGGFEPVRSHQLKQFEPLYQRKSTFTGALLVDPEGFEPSTFSMPLRRAPNCAMGPD